ncbi:MAG TPA: hypothetical protein VFD92_24290 [Candidatus Binatia bacterium]|nr:hypothetical protein [Candidatus Binatia bacterium]
MASLDELTLPAIRVAPGFHDAIGLAARIAVATAASGSKGAPTKATAWRALSAAESDGVLRAPANELGPDEIALVRFPAHLRASWRALAREGAPPESGFVAFVAEFLRFLRFKRLPLPERCRCDVVESAPGSAATGLARAARGAGGLRCIANLEDDPTYAWIACMEGAPASPTAPARSSVEPARRAARAWLRIRLEPGDGLWLGDADVVIDGWTIGGGAPARLLTLRAEPSGPPSAAPRRRAARSRGGAPRPPR